MVPPHAGERCRRDETPARYVRVLAFQRGPKQGEPQRRPDPEEAQRRKGEVDGDDIGPQPDWFMVPGLADHARRTGEELWKLLAKQHKCRWR
jgi:hypothetical protein